MIRLKKEAYAIQKDIHELEKICNDVFQFIEKDHRCFDSIKYNYYDIVGYPFYLNMPEDKKSDRIQIYFVIFDTDNFYEASRNMPPFISGFMPNVDGNTRVRYGSEVVVQIHVPVSIGKIARGRSAGKEYINLSLKVND